MTIKFVRVFVVLTFFLCNKNVFSQEKSNSLWKESNRIVLKNSSKSTQDYPKSSKYFYLNTDNLRKLLDNAPQRNDVQAKNSNIILQFPNSEGNMETFRIVEASSMTPDFQALFPNIRSYTGIGIDNPASIIRFSMSDENGLSSMVLSDKSTVFIEPSSEDLSTYVVYARSSSDARMSSFICETEEIQQNMPNFDYEAARNANDGRLRTFRLALACTGEYAQFHGGTLANVVAAMNASMTRVNGVFERDLALTMVMVNNTSIIFFNAGTDPYTNNNGGTMLGQNITTCNNNIGAANYDIGHVFSTGGGGVAYLNSPCTGNKAGGVTGSGSPVGDTFDIDYVAHEMGHQYGGNHTQNNNCNRSAVSVEPGSASTIMGYAGICAPNVQGNSDDYFHGSNIREMWANISAGNSQCAAQSNTSNAAPVANAGANYNIPRSTPFVLRGIATDANAGNTLTYCWEQTNANATTMPPVATSTVGPAFRSLLPKLSPNRYMPDFATVLAGSTATTWEVVPSVARTMNFQLTVRDNVAGGASSSSSNMTVTTRAAAGPFVVTSQGTPVTWNAGASQIITWNVAGTTANGVNTANVNILMTTDAGATFTTLLANTPNDGSQAIIVPNTPTTTARIIVEGAGNIFYNVNAANITIQTSGFTMNFSNTTQTVCAPNSAVYNFTYNTYLGFSGTTNFSATGNPAGTTVTFNPVSANTNNTAVTATVNGITNAMAGNYSLTISGTSGATVRSSNVTLNIFSSAINTVTLVSPTNGATNVTSPYNFNWNADVNATSYDIQIATDASFTTIVESQNVTNNSYTTTTLNANTQYFWRVRARNSCAVGGWSSGFNFTTANTICTTYNSTDTPLNIPDANGTGIPSIINVTTPVQISDVNVTVNLTHTWDDDLVLRLTSPSGTNMFLTYRNGGNGDNYTNTVFDDAAAVNIIAGVAPFNGAFQPEEPLSIFNNEISTGNWTLRAYDLVAQDTGALVNWSIEICGVDNCLSTTTWNGTAWSNGTPSINRNVILNGNFTTSATTPSFEACTLTINPNRTLTVSAGNYIKVQNDLTVSNNAVLDIQHEGSLVMVNDLGVVTNNGTMNVRKTTPTYVEYDYTYWSPPVQNATIATVFAANPQNRIYYFNTANFNDADNDSFDDEQNDWYIASGVMSPGIGLAAMGQGAYTTPINNIPYPTYTQSVVFSGPVNNGVYAINVAQDNSSTDTFINQNLLGNPYPSAIDPALFIQRNSAALEGTLYFWTHRTFISNSQPGPNAYNFSNDDYNSYNLSGMVASGAGQATPTNFMIASGQGFFANVFDPNVDVVFDNSMRVNTGNDNFYRTEESIVRDRIWLNLTNDTNVFRQTLIAFFDNTTDGYDRFYDAPQYENGNNYSFYSLIDSEEYAIQARETFNEVQEVHLGFENTQSGNLTISIGNFEGLFNDRNTNVYLEDLELGLLHDLKASDYTFYAQELGHINNRFVLRFNDATLSVSEQPTTNDYLILYEDFDTVNLHSSKNKVITSVIVYDVLGRLLMDLKTQESRLQFDSNRFTSGLLIFKVQLENEDIIIKKFVKK